jgi:hypothetical protein
MDANGVERAPKFSNTVLRQTQAERGPALQGVCTTATRATA